MYMKKILLILSAMGIIYFANSSFADNWVSRYYRNNGSCIHKHHKNKDDINYWIKKTNKCKNGSLYCNKEISN